MPRIIEFLGFDPHPAPIDLPDKLKAIRRNLGLSVKRLSSILKVDESVVTRWERGRGGPTTSQWRVIRNLYR
jgi:DNA-binding transcriptional regulator YiaG